MVIRHPPPLFFPFFPLPPPIPPPQFAPIHSLFQNYDVNPRDISRISKFCQNISSVFSAHLTFLRSSFFQIPPFFHVPFCLPALHYHLYHLEFHEFNHVNDTHTSV